MKTKYFLAVLISVLVASCNAPENNNNNNDDDTSPGVDEYFRVDINSEPWAVEDDEMTAAVLSDFGSGPRYGLSATYHGDSSHFFLSVPYFYINDTTWNNLSTPITGMTYMYYGTDSVYTGPAAGNLHIQRSNVDGLEVLTGTFNYTGQTIIHETPIQFTNGEFVIARIL